MNELTFLQNFKSVANAPNGVQRLRELVLQLAATGRLVPRLAGEGDSESLVITICDTREHLANEAGIRLTSPLSDVDSGTQSLSVPDHWRWIRLGNLTSKIGSGSTPRGGSKVYVNDGVPFLRSQNIWNDGVRLDDVVFISAETHEKMRSTQVHSNDILLNITGASLGRCAIVPTDFPAANVSQHVTIIRPLLPETRYFLHICLLSPFGQSMIWGRQVGMAREGLSKKVLEQFEIPLPPLEEQNRIVAKVAELMRLCDRLEAQQQEREKLLPLLSRANHTRFVAEPTEEFLSAVFSEPGMLDPSHLERTNLSLAVRGHFSHKCEPSEVQELVREISEIQNSSYTAREHSELKSLPPETLDAKGHCILPLGRIARIISGQHLLPSEYHSQIEGIPYITGPAEFGKHYPEPSKWTFSRRAVALLKDILLTVKGSGVGKTNLCNLPELAISRQLMAVRPLGRIRPTYIWICISAAADQFQAQKSGIAIPGIGREDVLNLVVRVPSLKEQDRIIAKFEQLRGLCELLSQKRTQRDETQRLFAQCAVKSFSSTEFKENEIMMPPKTEVVTSLKVGSRPKKSDMAPLTTLLLAQKAEASAKTLWQLSGLAIDVFYRQLKIEIANGWIEEDTTMRDVKEVEVG